MRREKCLLYLYERPLMIDQPAKGLLENKSTFLLTSILGILVCHNLELSWQAQQQGNGQAGQGEQSKHFIIESGAAKSRQI